MNEFLNPTGGGADDGVYGDTPTDDSGSSSGNLPVGVPQGNSYPFSAALAQMRITLARASAAASSASVEAEDRLSNSGIANAIPGQTLPIAAQALATGILTIRNLLFRY